MTSENVETVPKHKFDTLVQHCKRLDGEIAQARAHVNEITLYQQNAVWFWQHDGEDFLESLSCPIIIQPHHLRELLKGVAPAAQPQGEPVATVIGFQLINHRHCHPTVAWTVEDLPVGTRLFKHPPELPFQSQVKPWLLECFGIEISADRQERNHRFLEEALELVQANACTASEAHQLVDYVYGRPAGEPSQEVGGVMVTLAALCLAADLDMHSAADTELARIWTKVEQIRAKQAAKPAMSPLPGAYPDRAIPTTMCDCNQGRMPCRCKP